MEAWITQNAEAAQFSVFFSLLFLLGGIEALAPARRTALIRRQRWITNFGLTALNVVVLSVLPVTFVSAAIWADREGLGALNHFQMPWIAALAINLLARGFVSFGTHLLMHQVPLFWRVHRVHHLDTELDVSTTVRFHPFEFVLQLAMGLPLIVLLGLEPWILLLYESLDAAITVFSHANIALPPRIERWLRYVIVTPSLHRIHHSTDEREGNSNFGAVFPLWDLVFRTFRVRSAAAQATMSLGLHGDRGPHTSQFWPLLMAPFR
jgi:sterol desaturase/sphingolipid hydroxylase (fatty acid hydroxylase superfamily)